MISSAITWLKRMLLRLMRQYTTELEAQQTRFNVMANLPTVRERMCTPHAQPKIGGMYLAALIQAEIDWYRG